MLVRDSTGQKSFAIFNYARLEWTTGANNNGNVDLGLGGSPAQVHFIFSLEDHRGVTRLIINFKKLSYFPCHILHILFFILSNSILNDDHGEIFFVVS